MSEDEAFEIATSEILARRTARQCRTIRRTGALAGAAPDQKQLVAKAEAQFVQNRSLLPVSSVRTFRLACKKSAPPAAIASAPLRLH